MQKKQLFQKFVATDLLPQRGHKSVDMKLRIEPDLKFVFQQYCKKINKIPSQLLREWIFKYLQMKDVIRIVSISETNFECIDDMLLNVPNIKKVEINL